MLLTIFGQLTAFLGVVVALFGDTWDSSRKGLNKLKPIGWVAAIVALFGFSVSTYQTWSDHMEKERYKNIVLEEIRKGWGQIAEPLVFVLEQVSGETHTIDVAALQLLLANDKLSSANQLDFSAAPSTKLHGMSIYKDLGKTICQKTMLGRGMMVKAIDNNTHLVDPELTEEIKSIGKTGTIARFVMAGCGSNGVPANPALFAGMFDTPKMRQYINRLISIGKQLGFRDIK